MTEKIIDIEKSSDLIYDFIQNGYDNMQKEQVYDGITMNMVLIHTLIMVYKNPGINVTQVSQLWGHTRSAASKNVARLEQYGFLEKRKMPDNKKEMCLFATPKGERAAKKHIEYDNIVIDKIMTAVSCKYSVGEIEKFLDILSDLNDLIKEDN